MYIEEGTLFQYQAISNRISDPGVGRKTPLVQPLVHDFHRLNNDYHRVPLRANLMQTLPMTMSLPNARLENTSKCKRKMLPPTSFFAFGILTYF